MNFFLSFNINLRKLNGKLKMVIQESFLLLFSGRPPSLFGCWETKLNASLYWACNLTAFIHSSTGPVVTCLFPVLRDPGSIPRRVLQWNQDSSVSMISRQSLLSVKCLLLGTWTLANNPNFTDKPEFLRGSVAQWFYGASEPRPLDPIPRRVRSHRIRFTAALDPKGSDP